jgi:hypothetical protein
VALPDAPAGDSADVSRGTDAEAGLTSRDGTAEATTDAADRSVNEAAPEAPVESGAGDAAASVKLCFARCTSSDECPSTELNPLFCNTATQHCVHCLHDVTCVAQQSAWIGTTCTDDADCSTDVFSFGDYCVDVDGTGRCAFDFSRANSPDCFGTSDSFTVKKFATDTMVTVCADTSRTCDEQRGICVGACTGSSCTPARGGTSCNAQTGRCECATNTDCGSGASVCNTALRQCECASSDECPGADAGTGMVCE